MSSSGSRPIGRFLALAAGLSLALGLAGGATASGALHASATLRDVGGETVGWAQFSEDATGILHVNVHVKGLSSGLHGIHIHAVANCTPFTAPSTVPFSAAGGHHNPLGASHGLLDPPGAHAGDLPNLEVNVAGLGHLDAISDRATLAAGPTTIFDADGSALVIHANEDDQVTNTGALGPGNSGARIACGIIEAD